MTAPDRGDLRWTLVLSIYLLWAASGVMQTLSLPPLWLLWLNAILTAVVVTTWCTVDARHRGNPIVPVLQLLLLLTWPIGAPIYLLRSRGWRGLVLAIAHAMGLMLTHSTAFYGAMAVAR